MSTDWREKEREFLASLEADTGRDLAEWMALIAAQKLPHRNDIIDWLRRQGFMFSRASWLERIHHNGGQPIYLEAGALAGAAGSTRPTPLPAPAAPPAPARAEPDSAREREPPVAPAADQLPPEPSWPVVPRAGSEPHREMGAAPAAPDMETRQTASPPAAPATTRAAVVSPPAATPEALAETLAKAKAYRPLAQFTLRSIEAALPGLTVSAGPSHLVLSRPLPFGLVGISGKDIRLALNLGDHPTAAPFEPVRLPVTSARAAGPLTHMIVLTDARQVDAALIALVVRAAGLANP